MHVEPNQIIPFEQQSGGELSLSRPPETVLREAEMVAAPWSRKVESLTLYKTIGDKKHLYIEAWQMMAAMYRVTARVRETRYVDMGEVKGYEAIAEAYHIPTGQVLSMAEGMCLSDEDKWGPRTKYEYVEGKRTAVGFVPTPLQQLRSMAQTRACSKVLSNLFKWVAVQKGYQGTPAEEMTGQEYEGEPKAPAAPQRKSQAAPKPATAAPQQQQTAPPPEEHPGNGGGHRISDPQRKRLWAISMNAGLSKDQTVELVKSFGFARADEVTTDRYEEICAALQGGGNA